MALRLYLVNKQKEHLPTDVSSGMMGRSFAVMHLNSSVLMFFYSVHSVRHSPPAHDERKMILRLKKMHVFETNFTGSDFCHISEAITDTNICVEPAVEVYSVAIKGNVALK